MKLDEEHQALLKDYLKTDHVHSQALDINETFKDLFKEKGTLTAWIKRCQKYEEFINLQTFIRGVVRDKKAVNNQIKETLSNGLVEGLVGKLKAIKRRTYGRCGFELLRSLIF